MNEGAPIAPEIANVTVSSDNLSSLVDLRRIAMQLMDRIQFNYNSIVGVNGALVGLGLFPGIDHQARRHGCIICLR